MRMSTDEEPRRGAGVRDDRGGSRGGDHRVRHRARVRAWRGRARPQRAAARPRPASLRRGGDRADRDEGRHGTGRRRVDPGRSGEGDPRRLRGQPRCARRPSDRPLPDPRTRIHGHRGEPRCARSHGSSTTAWCGTSAFRTSTACNWTRRSSSRLWRPFRSHSAPSTTARCGEESSSAAKRRGSP